MVPQIETPTPNAGTPTLTDNQRKVYETMKNLGATSPEKGKTADDIMKAGKFPKGQMLSWIQELEKTGIAKRVAGDKAARYYLLK